MINFAERFLIAVTRQDAEDLRELFAPNAVILWHNTNEAFTVSEYIRANCEYPGDWDGKIERVEQTPQSLIVVSKVWTTDAAFRVVSFLEFSDEKIRRLDEYWGNIGEIPEWRRKMNLGKKIMKLD